MRNIESLKGLALLPVLCLGACASEEPASGDDLELSGSPIRIVSLVPSATRTLQALNVTDLMVGRTDYDTMGGIGHLPSVGGGLNPSPEALLLLDPDLVIRFDSQADPATPDVLRDLGLPTLTVRLDHIADVRDMIQKLGSITGSEERAGILVSEMDAALEEVRELVAGRPPRRVAYVLGGNPLWVAGPNTFIQEILVAAGGKNVFSDLEGQYGPVSPEEFLVRDIDVLMAPEGVEVRVPRAGIPLVRVSPALELPGPDLARAIREVATLLHPEVFR
jgi:iron complex transport system substrate-binding protein